MQLSPSQLVTFKAAIAANTATIPAGQPWSGGFVGVQVKDVPNNSDGNAAVAGWYNLTASPDYYVWNSAVTITDILDKITWTNFTPNDSPDNTFTYNNRAFNVQIKQQNLSLLFLNRTVFDAGKVNLRAALNDATTNLPTGAAGANRSGGWATILPILSRKANNVEKVFAADDGAGIGNNQANPRGDNTNPDTAVFEGTVSASDVETARNLS